MTLAHWKARARRRKPEGQDLVSDVAQQSQCDRNAIKGNDADSA